MRLLDTSVEKVMNPRSIDRGFSHWYSWEKSAEDALTPASHLDKALPPLNSATLTPLMFERVAAGDQEAVTECLDRFGGLVWSLARRMSPNLADAEDAVQEIFVEIWQNAHRFNPEFGSEATFITVLARRRLIDRARKRGRTIETTSVEFSAEPVAIDEDRNEVDLGDEAAKAVECMKRLREEQRDVLKMSIYEGLSHEKISAMLGKPLGTIKSLARRGLIQVRDCMSRSGRPGYEGDVL
jgi:RNA polymerase sigma-70 factor (ECF subfamily)